MKRIPRITRLTFYLALCLLSVACTPAPEEVTNVAEEAPIYPDYANITIPYNIAPLNFLLRSEADAVQVTVSGNSDSLTVSTRGTHVCFPLRKWRELLQSAKGSSLQVSVLARVGGKWQRHPSFSWQVSADKLDAYLSYRLIEPGYEVWNEVEIRERCVENYDEKVVSSYKNTENSCMNCHVYGNKSGTLSMFHLRGKQGGTILNRDGRLRKLILKDGKMVSEVVYGDFHPTGRFGVFSTNIIIPSFHTQGSHRFEVYDTVSDLVIADFDENRMIHSPLVARQDVFETFPTFSSDGKYVYYCAADTVSLPRDIKQLKYSLCRIAFDAEEKRWGSVVDTVWDARKMNASVCHPKASPDGKFLLYTVADFGTFPIWHRETDLQLLNLETGTIDSLKAVNAPCSDTYHSWSSSGRWFVFASKRGDGQYGKPYFCHIDEQGIAGKPFVLPQKNPDFYDNTLRSFNIPDLSATSLTYDSGDIGEIYQNLPAEPFH